MTKPAVSIITPVRATNEQHVEWLHGAVGSVVAQSASDWEMVIVDDHSTVELPRYVDEGITILQATGNGASAARNQAAEAARSDLLLPLDADDQLAPNALETFLKAWEGRGDAGIIYSDIVMFGQDFARVYLAPEYSFRTLLKATFMLVGSLHLKADWQRVGGWRPDMEGGLEDWEYWLAMGEMGVCGKRVPEPLYWYRRRAGGRLAALKADPTRWHKAYQKMRALHTDSYNGRFPMGCCGGAAQSVPKRPRAGTQPPQITGDRVPIVYIGARKGDFWIVGQTSRVRYHIMGQGEFLADDRGRVGVDRRDVQAFTSMNRGRNFKVVHPPAPAAPKPVAQAVPEKSEAWEPVAMEEQRVTVSVPQPGPGDLTLKQLRALKNLTAKDALRMLGEERGNRNRVGAIRFLEKVAGG